MEFFKINKNESAVVRILHTSVDTIPVTKVHNIPITVEGKEWKATVKCTRTAEHACPLCEKYPKDEYIKVIYLYDYTDGKEKCFKTSNVNFIDGLNKLPSDWEVDKLSDLAIKISRANDDFGSYSAQAIPAKNYPMPTVLEGKIDDDVTYRFGLYRSDSEMRQYLETGSLPKHTKYDPNNPTNKGPRTSKTSAWASQYNEQELKRAAEREAEKIENNNATNYDDVVREETIKTTNEITPEDVPF